VANPALGAETGPASATGEPSTSPILALIRRLPLEDPAG